MLRGHEACGPWIQVGVQLLPPVKGQSLNTEPTLKMVIYALPQCEVTASVFRVRTVGKTTL